MTSPGDTWRCTEDDAPKTDAHDVELWPSFPRFTAVVDRVEGDYVELTVATGNDHPRTPAFGASLAKSLDTLKESDRWKLTD